METSRGFLVCGHGRADELIRDLRCTAMDVLSALAKAKTQSGIQELTTLLLESEDDQQARLVAMALARVEAVASLTEALCNALPIGRDAALDAMITVRSAVVVSGLIARIEDEPDPWRQRRRVLAAGERDPSALSGLSPQIPGVVIGLLRAGYAAQPTWLLAAVESAWGANARLVGELEWWFAAGNGATPSELRATNPFVQGLTVGEPEQMTLEDIRELDDSEVSHMVLAYDMLLSARTPKLARALIGRLAGSRSDEATRALCAATNHPVPAIRNAALAALSDRKQPAVWRAYRDWVADEPDQGEVIRLIWTVSRRREPACVQLLIDWCSDERDDIRTASVLGLAERAGKSSRGRTPEVRAALERWRDGADTRGPTKDRVASALAKFGPA